MYALPDEARLSFLNGATLLQVCIGANEATLNFHERIRITIMTLVRFTNATGEYLEFDAAGAAAAPLLGLLGQPITTFRRVDDKTLRLAFGTAGHLELVDTSEQYESFWLEHEKELIVV
jgi:hypothetical protein